MPFLPFDDVLPKESQGWPWKARLSQHDFSHNLVYFPQQFVENIRQILGRFGLCMLLAPMSRGKSYLSFASMYQMAIIDNVDCWYCTFKPTPFRTTTFQEARNHLHNAKRWQRKTLHVIEDYHILSSPEIGELWGMVSDFENPDAYFLFTRRKLASLLEANDPILSELKMEEEENQEMVIRLQKQLYPDYIAGIVGGFVRDFVPNRTVSDEEKQEFARKMSTNLDKAWRLLKTWGSKAETKHLADIDEKDVLNEDYQTIQKLEYEFPGSENAILKTSAIAQFENVGVHADFLKKSGSDVERAARKLVEKGYLNTKLRDAELGKYFYLWDNKDGNWWLRAAGFGRARSRAKPLGAAFASDYTKKTILEYLETQPLLPNIYDLLACLSREGKAELVLSAIQNEQIFAKIESDIFADSGLASARKLMALLHPVAIAKTEHLSPELANKVATVWTRWANSLQDIKSSSLQKMGVGEFTNLVNLSSKVLKNTRPSAIPRLFEIAGTVLLYKLSFLNSLKGIVTLVVAAHEVDPDRMKRYLSTRELRRKVARIAANTSLQQVGQSFRKMPWQLKKEILSCLMPEKFASKVGQSSASGVYRFLRYSKDLTFKHRFLRAISKFDFRAMLGRSSAENTMLLLRNFNYAKSELIRQEGRRLTGYFDLETVQFLINTNDTEGQNKLFYTIALSNESIARDLLEKGLRELIVRKSTPRDLSWILAVLVEDERLLPIARTLLSNVSTDNWKEKVLSVSDEYAFWLMWNIYQADPGLAWQLVKDTSKYLLNLIYSLKAEKSSERLGLLGLLTLCNVSVESDIRSLMNMLRQVESPTCFFLGLELLKRTSPTVAGVEEWLVVKAAAMAEKLDNEHLVQTMRLRFLDIIKHS